MTDEARPDKGLLGRAVAGASDRVFEIVDPDMILEHVDVNALLDRVEVNDLLDRVEVNDLLDRVDVDALLDRVDVNALMDRADVDRLLQRADIDALMERVDVKRIVDRAGIPEIVAESTTHLGGSALDLFRRPLVGLDEIIFRVLTRLRNRDPASLPAGPGDLVGLVDEEEAAQGIKTGRYAGPLTRLLAVLLDSAIVVFLFTVIAGFLTLSIQFVSPDFELSDQRGLWYGLALFGWSTLYMWISFAVFGKTVGKMVLGIRVVRSDGRLAIHGRSAFLRALTFPLSLAMLGIGLLGVLFGKERRAWHDHFAGTAVVYDWGSRTAAMPTPLAEFLERRKDET